MDYQAPVHQGHKLYTLGTVQDREFVYRYALDLHLLQFPLILREM